MLSAREYDMINIRAYLQKLSEHVDSVERGEQSEHDLDIMSDALVFLLGELGYQPEDFAME